MRKAGRQESSTQSQILLLPAFLHSLFAHKEGRSTGIEYATTGLVASCLPYSLDLPFHPCCPCNRWSAISTKTERGQGPWLGALSPVFIVKLSNYFDSGAFSVLRKATRFVRCVSLKL